MTLSVTFSLVAGIVRVSSDSSHEPDQHVPVSYAPLVPSLGENGTALLVGHHDTRTGPAIFLNLNALRRGDKADGETGRQICG